MTTKKIIAVGGFQHETNTFAPHRAPFEAFERADSWPGLTRGPGLFDVMPGLNIPLSGFIEKARPRGHELEPLLWCAAEPSSYVTRDAFDRIAALICEDLRAIDGLEAVYLDLHGAMVCEHTEDGEGELLTRVREVVGDEMPVVISLDLHANVTRAMLGLCDAMTIYRTYPHLDMAATGARAFDLLQARLDGRQLHRSMLKVPFLIPLPAQCTDFDPCRSLYAELADLSARPGVSSVDIATGFPPSDIGECGAAVVAYGEDAAAVEAAAEDSYLHIVGAEGEFRTELFTPDAAVIRAMDNRGDKPVVLADAQDNPGAGATSDTTGVLQALVANGAQRAVIAILFDPEVAEQAHAAGIGAEIEAALGAKMGFPGVEPYRGRFTVEALGDGRFVFTGDMNKNSHAELGDMALLRVVDDKADVRVVVGSSRAQCLDQAIIRHLGIEPSDQKIVVVKSTVHFRADFDPIANETLVVKAPGANYCDHTEMDYQNLRTGVRIEPLGAEHRD